jgi:hypothetical protein
MLGDDEKVEAMVRTKSSRSEVLRLYIYVYIIWAWWRHGYACLIASTSIIVLGRRTAGLLHCDYPAVTWIKIRLPPNGMRFASLCEYLIRKSAKGKRVISIRVPFVLSHGPSDRWSKAWEFSKVWRDHACLWLGLVRANGFGGVLSPFCSDKSN